MRPFLVHFGSELQAKTLLTIMGQWPLDGKARKQMQEKIVSNPTAAALLARGLDDQWQVSDAIMSSLHDGVAEDAVLDFDYPHTSLNDLRMCDCW